MPLKPGYLFLAGAGAIVVYAGFKGKGLASAVRQVISGQSPADAAVTTAQIQQAHYGYAASANYGYGANIPGSPSPTGTGQAPGTHTAGGRGSGGSALPPPTKGGKSAPVSMTGNKALGFVLVVAAGWGSQWGSFNNIVMAESSWNNRVWNGGSTSPTRPPNSDGGYGIPQATPFNKMPKAAWPPGYGGSASPVAQIKWMIGYIRSVYGNPDTAWRHHLATGIY